MENKKQTRDYDNEPIVIKDYNSLFLALFAFSFVPVMIFIYIYNPGGTSEGSLFRNIIIIIPLMMYPYFRGYFKARGKRKIIFLNEKIKFFHEDILLEEIELSKVTEVRKTYSNLYHKSQLEGDFGKIISYIVFPFAIMSHLILIFNKYLFHIYKDGKKSYRFFDAIIIFEGEKFINILPSTLTEYKEIKEYLKKKQNVNIDKNKVFYNYSHLHEKIKGL